MASRASIRTIPLNRDYSAVRFQGYDADGNELPDCAETALTTHTSMRTALRFVVGRIMRLGYAHDDIEPPRRVEDYKETDID